MKIFAAFLLFLATLSNAYAGTFWFPLNGYYPYSTPVSAFPDLDSTVGKIKIRSGQIGETTDGCLAYVNGSNVECTSGNTNKPRAYKTSNASAWNADGIQYDDGDAPGYNLYMWYDNHNGYDYVVPQYTTVHTVESGTLKSVNYDLGQVEVEHIVGGVTYRTYYTHMIINGPLPITLSKWQHIGWVSDVGAGGAVHLHFVVKKWTGSAWKVVDPYGSTGESYLWN